MAVVMIVLGSVVYADAETYRWTDDRGVVSFTDDPGSIPRRYREKAQRSEDITTRNPKVQEELLIQKNRAIQEEANRPRIAPTPDYVPPPAAPPVVAAPTPAADELPPGRTKSQRIKDNIQRREAEEKAGVPGQK